MGIETTKALQGRRRESDARIDRLISQAEERSPVDSVRRARIEDSARFARRRIRALAAVQRAAIALEVEIGQAVLRLENQGMSRNQAFKHAGLRRHLGRRYIELALRAQNETPGELSTGPRLDVDPVPVGTHFDHDGAPSVAITPEGKP